MERKPITIYLDNLQKQKNNLYQKKIILPKKYKPNSNSFKKIKPNNIGNQNKIMKPQNNNNKIYSYNIKEIKANNSQKEPKDSIRKKDVKFNKNKYNNDIKSINSIIFIQKIFRGFSQRKKLKNIKSRIYIIKPQNKNKSSANNIFDAIKRNSKNQKEIIQLNNNRFNNRNTMSPKSNIKMNIIYKKNLILLKKENLRKKNYSFDYKHKESNNKQNELINPYKSKNKNIITNLNKNKKNGIKGHLRINSCGNINNDININNKDAKTNPINKITFNNKNSKNKNNKSFISTYQTKENSNSNTGTTNKSNLESPKNSNKINSEKINLKQDKNILKNDNKTKKIKEEKDKEKDKDSIIVNKPIKTEICFDHNIKEKSDTEEKKSKNFHLVNNSGAKYNFNPMIRYSDDKKKEKNKSNFKPNLDMPKFFETKKNNLFESIKEEKFNDNDNENDTDLKSSFYDDEEFVIINYDYTLNDKKKALKISRVDNINIDGYLRRKMDFVKFLKKGIYSHVIKYAFNLINNINKKKIEIDKTMTDNGNASFIQQERIEKNKNVYNKAQLDINNDDK